MKTAGMFYQVASLLLQIPVLVVILMITLVQFDVVPQIFFWIIITLLHLSLFPMLYGAFVYKTRRISNPDIMERKERVIPFFVITFIYGVFLFETILFDAPAIFKTLAVHYFILALILSIVTAFWKVSVHTAGVTQLVALLSVLIGSQVAFFLPLVILVGWLRIKMKSHDIWQVLGGIGVALVCVFVAEKFNFL